MAIQNLVKYASDLTQLYAILQKSKSLEPAHWHEDVRSFRHINRDDGLFVFLKGVHYVSTMNAALVLLLHGFTNELGILCRSMDEAGEDALLFIGGVSENEPLKSLQQRVLTDFFQEEFEDINKPMKNNNKRDRVPRKSIRAAIGSLSGNAINPHDTALINGVIYQTYSGFVHAAYPHIMHRYNHGIPGYHLSGMLDTPRIPESLEAMVNYIHRGIMLAQQVAYRFGEANILEALLELRSAVEGEHPDLAEDPAALLAKLKARG